MNNNFQKQQDKLRRKIKIRAKLKHVSERLRLSVFRSNKHIYGQIIDDKNGKTIVQANDIELKINPPAGGKKVPATAQEKMKKIDRAKLVGNLLAQKAKKHKISKVYFDRGGYKYQGRIKTLAETARTGGLEF